MQKIANAISDEKYEALQSEAKKLRKSKPNKDIPENKFKDNFVKELAKRENMTEKEKIEELYNLLEIDQSGKHREKMNGMSVLFSTPEKNSRYTLEKNISFSEKKAEDIRREVDLQRKQRLAKRMVQEQEEKERNDRNKEVLKRIYVDQVKKRQGVLDELKAKQMERTRVPTYKEIKNKQLGIPTASQHITWKILKTLSYHNIGVNSTDEQFTPSDFISESKDEDEVILRKLEQSGLKESKTKASQMQIAKEFGQNESNILTV